MFPSVPSLIQFILSFSRINEVRGLPEICRIEAHDAEVLCLEYTRQDSGHKLLASASRDRLIHVFSVDEV